jgi:dTDP-4-dehydrorhamnose 3,5-epimerase-like enzyme
VVTRDVPANAIVVGNPARISGYVSSGHKGPIPVSRVPMTEGEVPVRGVRLQSFPVVEDLRGKLSFGEYGAHLPFVPRRYFVVYDVPSQEVRGEHAHRKCHQMMVCLKGTVEILVDDGSQRAVVPLTDPSLGIHVPPLIWTSQYKYSKDALLLVLASEEYDPEDYIRNYEEFLKVRKG